LRLLLDTHALVWWSADDPTLPTAAARSINDPDTTVYVSAASVWEISIKFSLGKLPGMGTFVADLRNGIAIEGMVELPIGHHHAVHAGTLEIPHKDPFDRLLIAQAQLEDLVLVSNERLFDRFGVQRLWA
jgi:PIN domain nuclease of toxin-antitoxin system